jgi:hypothetical protein
MDRLQVVKQIQEYLDRTPITGAEAATMVVCRQWLKNTERALTEVGQNAGNSPAPVLQVAGTSEK